ncbi:hypothetical protein RND81_13G016700 [Saponaria officinalis]|uniref:Uncharacterized protein n=1 Tax=Saponaria officinalis TaxID=3572 RepID=A0AAW1H3A2_SAPOF
MGYSNHDDDHKSSNQVNQDHDDHGDDVQDNGKESHCLIIDNSICIDIDSFLSDIDDQSLQNSPVLVDDDVAEVVNPSTLHPQLVESGGEMSSMSPEFQV